MRLKYVLVPRGPFLPVAQDKVFSNEKGKKTHKKEKNSLSRGGGTGGDGGGGVRVFWGVGRLRGGHSIRVKPSREPLEDELC